MPGTATLNQGGQQAALQSVSCAAPGNCSGDGNCSDGAGDLQAFVVNETDGTWRSAEQVPGTATLNQGDATGLSVSCAAPGKCTAGGYYGDGSGTSTFVDSET